MAENEEFPEEGLPEDWHTIVAIYGQNIPPYRVTTVEAKMSKAEKTEYQKIWKLVVRAAHVPAGADGGVTYMFKKIRAAPYCVVR
jgi:hypothetical protein